jgi:hypothetical protein
MVLLRFVVGDGFCHAAHRTFCKLGGIKSTKQTAVSCVYSFETLTVRKDVKGDVTPPLKRAIRASNLEFHGVGLQCVAMARVSVHKPAKKSRKL